MIASIIIPTFNRQSLTDRAIKSVLDCTGSDQVQIIVIDDCSTEPFSSELLRSHDILIRNNKNQGAAKSRQIGIEVANGDVIYFLDSDDYFVSRNFIEDFKIIKETEGLYYCDYNYEGGKKPYTELPSVIPIKDYFNFIFKEYPGIANTCSICFNRSLRPSFDQTLIQHEDWDFVYSFLKKGYPVKKIKGEICIDRSDKKSLSRKKDYKKSLPWLSKLKENEGDEIYRYAKYWALSKYQECMPISEFIGQSYYLLIQKKININLVVKRLIQRFL